MIWFTGVYRLVWPRWTVLALLLAGALCGCSSPPDRPVRIGILMFGNFRQPQVTGFRDGLTELGYVQGKNVQYIVLNARHKRAALKADVRKLLHAKVDLLAAAGGLEADVMKKLAAPHKVPVVVLYINTIVQRGLVKSRRHPGWDVTGVDNLNAELSGKRVELLHDLLPRVHRVLVLYSPHIIPSRIGVERARRAAAKYGMTIVARAVSTRAQIRAVMDNLKPGEVDAMLTVPNAPIDSAVKNIIVPNVRRLHLPVMTHSRHLAEEGALASYAANLYGMGKQAARLADKVLHGIAAHKLPFETPKRFLYCINQDSQHALHLKLDALARSEVNAFISTRSQ